MCGESPTRRGTCFLYLLAAAPLLLATLNTYAVRLTTGSAIEQYLEARKEKAIRVEFKRGEKKVVDLSSP